MSPLRLLAVTILLAQPLAAQETAPAAVPDAPPAPTTIMLHAAGQPAVTVTPETLATLPMLDQRISFESHGGETGDYRGVLLWDLLAANTAVEEDVKTALRDTVLVTARDGHQVAWAIGDLAPDFGNSPVMLAVERDGAALDQGLRMVVPGDRRGARNIRDVVRIELR